MHSGNLQTWHPTNCKKGDWIIGTGSSTLGLDNRMVYAMQVDEILTFQKYDLYCKSNLKEKIPDIENDDPRRWVGDCIYDFDHDPPKLKDSFHNEDNRETDLAGKHVLLSTNFIISDSLLSTFRLIY